jgi:hypothetical protein
MQSRMSISLYPVVSLKLGRPGPQNIVLGARIPVIVATRTDNERTRRASCALAVLAANGRQARPSQF